jgi:hypothetical protein
MAIQLATTELKTPLRGTVRRVNFYNGGLLTAEDLADEQSTREAERHQLARMLGEGIASGLLVSEHRDSSVAQPVVTVEPGLAVAPSGRVLELKDAVDLQLLRSAGAAVAGDGGLFADCMPTSDGAYTAGRGVYLLVLGPDTLEEGAAPARADVGGSCGPRYVVESVRFRLVWVALTALELLDTGRLRNRVAHMMLGTGSPVVQRFRVDPRAQLGRRYGLLDELRANLLAQDEVPLATIGWRSPSAAGDVTAGAPGIQFVDVWSARRPLRPDEPRLRYPLLGERRRFEGEAAFLQFTDEVEDLLAGALAGQFDLRALSAGARFLHLPAVGILPLARETEVGVRPDVFFGRQALPEVATLDADLLPSLVDAGAGYEPIRVGGADRIQLYVVWENFTHGQTFPDTRRVPEPILVFAKATIPYRGTARFDHAMWSQSRYARIPL